MKNFTFDKGLVILLLAVVGFYVGRKLYFKPSVIQGDQAPNFTAQMIDDQAFELAQLEGSYVLLDFWGSWCGPCRRENPELVKLYKKYQDKEFEDAQRFEIVSVGVEKDRNRWLNAIKQDRLNWQYHVSDFQEFNNEVAQLYGVRSIPSKFLINPKGIIIGVNLPLDQIDQILTKKIDTKIDKSLSKY
ncbi:MAG: TlpA disulfide reductase family protein [Bacteroidota bacterium]